MSTSRAAARSTDGDDAELAAFAHDTWNSPDWIARHREMSPGERIALTVTISQAALQFAHARSVERDGR